MIFIRRTVEHVSSTSCDHRNLTAARAALSRGGVGCDDAKLLNRVQGYGQNTLKSLTRLLVIHIHSVQRDVRLVAARAGNRTAASVWSDFIVNTCIDHAGLEAEQSGDIPRL